MDEGLLAAARGIRWFLPELVGPAAECVDAELAKLLTKAAESEDIEVRLREVLEHRQETSAFLYAVLDDAPDYRPPQARPATLKVGGYEPLPSQAGPIDVSKYRCPQGDFDWYRQAVGIPIPVCPTHHCVLVRT